MRTHVRLLLISSCAVALAACSDKPSARPADPQHRQDAVFVNGNFEDGGLSGWAVATYLNKSIIYPPTSRASLQLQPGGVNKTKVITGAPESVIPSGLTSAVSLRIPKYGNNAAVVNEAGANYNVNALSQSFTVTAADVDPNDGKIHVRFALAPVLNSGGHPANQQPYFWVTLTNTTKGSTMFGAFNFADQAGVPWKIEGTTRYTDWQSFDIAPGNVALSIGDTIALEVIAAGCSAGGHFGEVYVDGFGAFLPGLSVTASAPSGANAGSNITYTLNYQNRGTAASNNTLVTLNLPTGVTYQSLNAAGASCTAPAVGASTGAVVCNVGTVSPNATGSFTITVKIDATATGKISEGNYSIRADSVSPLLGPLVETTITSSTVYVDLAASIVDNIAATAWGQPYSATFTVSNLGASTATSAPVSWTAPAELTGVAWTCAGSGGATCAASGSGSISTTLTLPAGSFVTYSVTANVIAGSAPGSMTNLLTVTVPGGVTDTNTTNNAAIDINSIGTLRAFSVSKTGVGTGRLLSSPAAIDCGSSCSTSYLDGSLIAVTAIATTGNAFTGWSGACTGMVNPCVFTITSDTTLTAGFGLLPSDIVASAGAGGTISPAGTVSVVNGADQTFTITPSTNYLISNVLVDGVSVGAVASYTFTNVTAAHTIAASFVIQQYTVSVSTPTNGTITPSATAQYNAGTSPTFSIVPAATYKIVDVVVDGVSKGAVTSFTFTNISAAHSISATFTLINQPTVLVVTPGTTPWMEGAAAIAVDSTLSLTDPDGPNLTGASVQFSTGYVSAEDRFTFTAQNGISASFNSAIGVLTLIGSATAAQYEAALRSVQYANIASGTPTTGARTASFSVVGVASPGSRGLLISALPTFAIAATAGINGTVAPAGVTQVKEGRSQSYSITPDATYEILDVLVDGVSQGVTSSYTFTNVTTTHTIAAVFGLINLPAVMTVTAGSTPWMEEDADVAIDASLSLTDPDGPNLTGASVSFSAGYVAGEDRFTFTDQNGITGVFDSGTGVLTLTGAATAAQYEAALRSVQYSNGVTGTPTAGTRTATFAIAGTALVGSHDVVVTALPTFAIVANAGLDGTVTPSGTQTVKQGHGQSYSITPDAHFHVVDVLVDGASGGAVSSYTFSNVVAAHTLTAVFAVDTYAITATSDANGTVNCPSSGGYGEAVSCRITANAGYALETATDNGVDVMASIVIDTYDFTVTATHAVQVTFKKVKGGACSSAAECGSGQCVDGVCCNTSCGGQCESCAQAGLEGTCSPKTGAPEGTRTACATDGSLCGGACDGVTTAACSYPTASCRDASCASGVETLAASCNGAGACPAAVLNACDPFICGATACATACVADAQCASGFFCDASVCVPKLVPGGTCARDAACGSGNCVDGFCCNSGCNGQCEACDVAGHEGTCTPATGAPHQARTACDSDGSVCGGACDGVTRTTCAYPAAAVSCRGAACANDTATLSASCDGAGACPSVQTQACGNFVCGASACLGDCTVDANCATGNWCSGGVCVPKLVPGGTCGADSQCGSGFCTDGVCCNASCDGQCEACNVPSLVGTCSPVTGAPHAGRVDCASDESVCGGSCDGTLRTACIYPQANTQCRAPKCGSAIGTLAAACDGQGSCPSEQTIACTPFVCGATACLGDCTADADCASGHFCAAGVCTTKLPVATACASNSQCGTGQCVDGVCCNTACNGQCQACDVAGQVGTCSPVMGSPHGARTACATDGSSCGGQCDGQQTTACAYKTDTCRASACAGGTATLSASCSQGHCPAVEQQSCGKFVCGATACKGDCAVDGDCAQGNYCAAGVCAPRKVVAGTCTRNNQCGSGNCVDGVCCNTACNGQCEACDVAGSVGTCVAAVGAPHAGRSSCAADSATCGGACDGSSRTSCSYPQAAVSCVSDSCTHGVETHGSSCNGSGQCSTPVTALCGRYSCGDTACNTSCTSDTQCSSDSYCKAGACQAIGDHTLWAVQGGAGCSSTGGSASLWMLALLMAAVLGRFKARTLAKAAVVAVAVVAGAAQAQATADGASRSFLLERFSPQAGTGDVLGVQSAQISKHLRPNVMLWGSYANMPLRAVSVSSDGQTRSLAMDQTTITAMASLGLFDRLEVALAIPFVATESASAMALDPALGKKVSPTAVADMRVQVKARLLTVGAFGFAVSLPVTLPTGERDAYAGYVGATANPMAIGEWQGARRSSVVVNAGVAFRPTQQLINLTVGNAFTYGLGGRVDLVPTQNLALLLNVGGEVGLAGASAVQSPLEALAALRWMPIQGLALTLGAGPGLSSGYGTPRFRVVGSIGWVPGEELTPVPTEPMPAPEPVAAPVVVAAPDPAPVVVPEPVVVVPEPVVEAPAPVVAAPAPLPPVRVIRTLEKVYFPSGKSEALASSLKALDEIAQSMQMDASIHKLRVEAHTDNAAPAAYNLKLSTSRASWVRNYLIKKGVAAERLESKGFGLENPIADNATAEGRSANRRVEFVVVE